MLSSSRRRTAAVVRGALPLLIYCCWDNGYARGGIGGIPSTAHSTPPSGIGVSGLCTSGTSWRATSICEGKQYVRVRVL